MGNRLQHELSELVHEKVISSEVANDISNYYLLKKAGQPNRLFTVFGILGALLAGLGILLIIAHNWDNFSRTVKTIWAFTPLLLGQGIAGFVLWKKKGAAWREAAATFMFFAVGACIALVSQIYNIPGELESFLWIWIVLTAPVFYILRSHAGAILHLVFSTYYACALGYFEPGAPWWYLAMLAWVVPHFVRILSDQKENVMAWIFSWLIPASMVIVLGAFLQKDMGLAVIMYLSLFTLMYNVGRTFIASEGRMEANGFSVVGSAGIVFTLLAVSFKAMWQEMDGDLGSGRDLWIAGVLLLAVALVLGYQAISNKLKAFDPFQYAVLFFVPIFLLRNNGFELPMALTNALVFVLGLYAIRLGAKRGRFGWLNFGMLIVTVLIVCRFFDVNIPFVLRGIIFLVLGAGFFVANYLMYQRYKTELNQKPSS